MKFSILLEINWTCLFCRWMNLLLSDPHPSAAQMADKTLFLEDPLGTAFGRHFGPRPIEMFNWIQHHSCYRSGIRRATRRWSDYGSLQGFCAQSRPISSTVYWTDRTCFPMHFCTVLSTTAEDNHLQRCRKIYHPSLLCRYEKSAMMWCAWFWSSESAHPIFPPCFRNSWADMEEWLT